LAIADEIEDGKTGYLGLKPEAVLLDRRCAEFLETMAPTIRMLVG
jgi:hypothetical protein